MRASSRIRRYFGWALGACSLFFMQHEARPAETYPARPVRLLVPSPPGGSPDIVARIVANKLSEQMKQQFVVDNRAGASGIVGVEIAKRSAPDGYTLLLMTSTSFASLPVLKRDLTYDAERDFIPLSRIAWVANVMAVNAGLGVNTVAEFVKLAKARPGKLNYGSAGNGSPAHLAGAMLNVLSGIDTVHVPYKGAAPAMTDLIGGELQFLITSPLVALPQARAGRVKVLATTGAQRDPLLPDLPVVADSVPGYEIVQWWGLGLPAGAPQTIVSRLHDEIVKALTDPQVRESMRRNGGTAQPDSAAEFTAFMRRERERIARVGRQANIRID